MEGEAAEAFCLTDRNRPESRLTEREKLERDSELAEVESVLEMEAGLLWESALRDSSTLNFNVLFSVFEESNFIVFSAHN